MRPEHSVIVSFDYGLDSLDALHTLSKNLDAVLKAESAGQLDGHEIANDNSDGILFMYGHDAEILFRIVKPVLAKASFMQGATATLRFGPIGEEALQITVDL